MGKEVSAKVKLGSSYQLSSQAQLSSLEPAFARAGHVISSWNAEEDGTGRQYTLEEVLAAREVSGDIDLWARWETMQPMTRVVYIDGTTSSFGVVGELTEEFLEGKRTRSDIKSCAIGYDVSSVGNGAFEYCGALANVRIPNSVTSIGKSAFFECSSMTSVAIPPRVTSIELGTFYGTGLTAVTIPEGVTSIGGSAFSNCKGLTSVVIPSSVTSIDDMAFLLCDSLTAVTIPEGVASIGAQAFCACSLESATIPSSVSSIGNLAFDSLKREPVLTFAGRTRAEINGMANHWWGLSESQCVPGIKSEVQTRKEPKI